MPAYFFVKSFPSLIAAARYLHKYPHSIPFIKPRTMSGVKYFLGFILLMGGIGVLLLAALFMISSPSVSSSFLTWLAAGGLIATVTGGNFVAKGE